MKYSIIIFLLIILTTSCQEVVDLDLPEGKTRLVVDGGISNLPGKSHIKLTYTAPYFDDNEAPVVSDAMLILSDNFGMRDTLTESPANSGIYSSEQTGQLGHVYTLDIYLADGKHYRSAPELLYESPPLDSIYFDENLAFSEEDKGYNIFLDTKDPPEVENFYRWKHFVNGIPQNEPLDLVLGFDEFIDGNALIGIQINLNPVQLGDTVRAEQWAISQSYYDYLFTLQQQTAFIGGLFDPPPAPIKGNVYNVDDPEDYALGYFHVSGLSWIEGIVVK